jgi:hypothetical protein
MRFPDFIRKGFFVILTIGILVMIFVAAVNIFDVKVDTFGINPSTHTNYKLIPLIHPASFSKSIQTAHMDTNGKYVLDFPILSLDILLSYNGYLVEGTPVNVSALGHVYGDSKNDILSEIQNDQPMTVDQLLSPSTKIPPGHYISIGFEGATIFNQLETAPPTGELLVNLHETEANSTPIFYQRRVMQNFTLPKRQITWENQGDYSPYVIIYYKNGTASRIVFDDYKIHVVGSDVLQQEKYSRINTSITIVLFFFSVIASIELLVRLNSKKTENENSSKSNQKPKKKE